MIQGALWAKQCEMRFGAGIIFPARQNLYQQIVIVHISS